MRIDSTGAGVTALLERDRALTELHRGLASATAGRGTIALVTGEAGAGKSSLVGAFLAQAAGNPLVLRGACDPLTVPRPFGPLIDAAGDVNAALARTMIAGVSRSEALALGLSLIDGSHSGARPTVLVIEDAHWADDATLDLLTYLGRRLQRHRALIIVTFRDEEVGPSHPLRSRLGELSSTIGFRVQLQPLSIEAVGELALGSGLDVHALHEFTGGNAFAVTEVIAAGGETLPGTVRDAVLARAGSLAPDARSLLDAASIVPGRVERWVLEHIAATIDVGDAMDACIDRGLLLPDAEGNVSFRHELARLCVLDGMPAGQRRTFHGRALSALRDPAIGRGDPARLAFHAAGAEDGAAVLEHAPIAAAQAAGLGAHREAARHLENAARYRHRLTPAVRAGLMVDLAAELIMIGNYDGSLSTYDEAIEAYESVGDAEAQADALVGSTRPATMLGRVADATERIRRAEALVGAGPPRRALARVMAARASAHMLAREFDAAEELGQVAMHIARVVGDDRVLASAMIQSGIALGMSGDDAGLERIRTGITVAQRAGDDDLVATGWLQIGSGYGELRRYDIAVPALLEGIAYAEARENVNALHYMTAWLGRCELELGQWDAAAADAGGLVRNPRCRGISRFVALVTLGWLRVRRGDPEVWVLLDEALVLARSTGHIQRLWPVAACRAEAAWMERRLDDELGLVDEVATIAAELRYGPALDELRLWRRVDDDLDRGELGAAQFPFGSVDGRPDLARDRWAALGCPYEQAVAMFAIGGIDDLRGAHRIFDALGAAPMRERTANAMRALGSSAPRRPAASAQANAHALTNRELAVLGLVATGLTNKGIAGELHISVKTVDHHVSNVLGKLGVRSRAEAAVAAERLGLTSTAVRR